MKGSLVRGFLGLIVLALLLVLILNGRLQTWESRQLTFFPSSLVIVILLAPIFLIPMLEWDFPRGGLRRTIYIEVKPVLALVLIACIAFFPVAFQAYPGIVSAAFLISLLESLGITWLQERHRDQSTDAPNSKPWKQHNG